MVLRSLALATVAMLGLAMMPTEASARWVCRATSAATGHWGWGAHNYSESYARRRALAECAVRTPRGYTCRLRSCVYQ